MEVWYEPNGISATTIAFLVDLATALTMGNISSTVIGTVES